MPPESSSPPKSTNPSSSNAPDEENSDKMQFSFTNWVLGGSLLVKSSSPRTALRHRDSPAKEEGDDEVEFVLVKKKKKNKKTEVDDAEGEEVLKRTGLKESEDETEGEELVIHTCGKENTYKAKGKEALKNKVAAPCAWGCECDCHKGGIAFATPEEEKKSASSSPLRHDNSTDKNQDQENIEQKETTFTAAQDAQIRELKAANKTWRAICTELKLPKADVIKRWKELVEMDKENAKNTNISTSTEISVYTGFVGNDEGKEDSTKAVASNTFGWGNDSWDTNNQKATPSWGDLTVANSTEKQGETSGGGTWATGGNDKGNDRNEKPTKKAKFDFSNLFDDGDDEKDPDKKNLGPTWGKGRTNSSGWGAGKGTGEREYFTTSKLKKIDEEQSTNSSASPNPETSGVSGNTSSKIGGDGGKNKQKGDHGGNAGGESKIAPDWGTYWDSQSTSNPLEPPSDLRPSRRQRQRQPQPESQPESQPAPQPEPAPFGFALNPDDEWNDEDCIILEFLATKYRDHKWLRMQADFYNWTGRMVKADIIETKFKVDGLDL